VRTWGQGPRAKDTDRGPKAKNPGLKTHGARTKGQEARANTNGQRPRAKNKGQGPRVKDLGLRTQGEPRAKDEDRGSEPKIQG